MHGQKKVERSALEEDKRARKLAAYQHAMQLIFAKRSKGELDDELLEIISQVLTANPDIGTLWNIRKEALLRYKEAELAKFSDLVPKELALVEACLRGNAKSYGAWYHRYWIMKHTNFERVEEEIKLCSKYLQYDDRNFHCWDYRKYLVDNSSTVTVDQDLDFTTEKIQSNFSNYSSWHLRSKLLPELSRDILLREVDLIKNAAFTDPNDQSVWLYHRWLIGTYLKEKSADSIVTFLQTELEWVKELNELEPDNKWAILTIIHLLHLIDYKSNKTWISELLAKLEKLDQKRSEYYRHLHAKYESEM